MSIIWQHYLTAKEHPVYEREDRLTLKSVSNLTARITSSDRHHGTSKVNTESPSGDGDTARCYAGSYVFVMVSEKEKLKQNISSQFLYLAEAQILQVIQNILEKYLIASDQY